MEKLLYSLGVAGLGMITVFAGLVILIVFITLLTKVTTAGGKKKAQPKAVEVKPVEKKEEAAAAPAAPAAPVNDGTPSPEVVAAIAAALTAIMGEGKFAVKHIRRINNAPAWNRAGRDDQIFSRF